MFMKNRHFWIGLFVGFIINQSMIYGAYFILRYAQFSLTKDTQSYWIQEIIERRIQGNNIYPNYNPPVGGPNRASGCSFLIFEELWRDCKSVRVRTTSEAALRNHEEVIGSTISNPCRWLEILPAGRRVDAAADLGCKMGSGPYRVRVFGSTGSGHFEFGVYEGRITK